MASVEVFSNTNPQVRVVLVATDDEDDPCRPFGDAACTFPGCTWRLAEFVAGRGVSLGDVLDLAGNHVDQPHPVTPTWRTT